MSKIPGQRRYGDGGGGGNHSESNFRSVRRGGRPSMGRSKKGGCTPAIVAGVLILGSGVLGVYHAVAGLL